jgi:hypothetical protein
LFKALRVAGDDRVCTGLLGSAHNLVGNLLSYCDLTVGQKICRVFSNAQP